MVKRVFYAVKTGSEGPAVTSDWALCEQVTKGFPNAAFKVRETPAPPPSVAPKKKSSKNWPNLVVVGLPLPTYTFA